MCNMSNIEKESKDFIKCGYILVSPHSNKFSFQCKKCANIFPYIPTLIRHLQHEFKTEYNNNYCVEELLASNNTTDGEKMDDQPCVSSYSQRDKNNAHNVPDQNVKRSKKSRQNIVNTLMEYEVKTNLVETELYPPCNENIRIDSLENYVKNDSGSNECAANDFDSRILKKLLLELQKHNDINHKEQDDKCHNKSKDEVDCDNSIILEKNISNRVDSRVLNTSLLHPIEPIPNRETISEDITNLLIAEGLDTTFLTEGTTINVINENTELGGDANLRLEWIKASKPIDGSSARLNENKHKSSKNILDEGTPKTPADENKLPIKYLNTNIAEKSNTSKIKETKYSLSKAATDRKFKFVPSGRAENNISNAMQQSELKQEALQRMQNIKKRIDESLDSDLVASESLKSLKEKTNNKELVEIRNVEILPKIDLNTGFMLSDSKSLLDYQESNFNNSGGNSRSLIKSKNTSIESLPEAKILTKKATLKNIIKQKSTGKENFAVRKTNVNYEDATNRKIYSMNPTLCPIQNSLVKPEKSSVAEKEQLQTQTNESSASIAAAITKIKRLDGVNLKRPTLQTTNQKDAHVKRPKMSEVTFKAKPKNLEAPNLQTTKFDLSKSVVESLEQDLKPNKFNADKIPNSDANDRNLKCSNYENMLLNAILSEDCNDAQIFNKHCLPSPHNEEISEACLLETIGFKIISNPSCEDHYSYEEYEDAHKRATFFAQHFQNSTSIWKANHVEYDKNSDLHTEFSKMLQSINVTFDSHLSIKQLKRLVNIVIIWYTKQCNTKMLEKKPIPKSFIFYIQLLSFLPKTSRRRYYCEFCSQHFTAEVKYIMHRNEHTGSKPFKCAHCDKTYAYSNTLLKHEKTHLDLASKN